MSVTMVADLIRLSMRELNAIASGDFPSADEYNDGLEDFNVMLSGYASDESLLPRHVYDNYSVNTTGILIGPGQTIDTDGRVLRILGAQLRTAGGDYSLAIHEMPDYQRVRNKTQNGPPCAIFLNATTGTTSGTIYFDCIPDMTYTLLLETQELFPIYNAINDSINLGNEYLAMLKWNLTVELSNQYPGITPFIVSEAKRSKERVQYLNQGYAVSIPLPSSTLVV